MAYFLFYCYWTTFCSYDHKMKLNCQLRRGPDPAHSVLNLMRAAFSHFKANWDPLTVNLQPWLVATGVSPRNLPVADALLIRPSRWVRGAPWEARTTDPYMARALSSSGARRVTHQHPLTPDGWHPSCHPPLLLLVAPLSSPIPRPRPGGVLIWQRVGMGSSAEVCEWWMSGIKGEPAPQRTVAGSAAALVGSFSPSRRNTPKVRPW